MASIYFHLNETQDEELTTFMKKEGHTNKSEFFRFLLKFYKYNQSPQMPPVTQIPDQASSSSSTPSSALAITLAPLDIKNHEIDDSLLSPEKQRLLNDPHIFDEEVKQFIREMEE